MFDPKAMLHICKKNINEIFLFFIDKDDLAFTHKMLESRFKGTVAVARIILFHQYDVLEESTVIVKRYSRFRVYHATQLARHPGKTHKYLQ